MLVLIIWLVGCLAIRVIIAINPLNKTVAN
jgi:hypothetical protein